MEKLRANSESEDLFEAFKDINDECWYWMITKGYYKDERLKNMLPGIPDDQIQIRFNGRAGEINFKQAFAVYLFCKRMLAKHFVSFENDNIMDFGCGWGRILRFWLKDLPRSNIFGVDCMQESIHICEDSNFKVNMIKNEPMPPLDVQKDAFALIYAHSVFSHLSKDAADKWIGEFGRLLKPGGLLIVTTRPRSFIEQAVKIGYKDFADTVDMEASYDAGEFLFEPTGGGGELSSLFYGEAFIPESYVNEHWNNQVLVPVDFIKNEKVFDVSKINQNIIVLQKRL